MGNPVYDMYEYVHILTFFELCSREGTETSPPGVTREAVAVPVKKMISDGCLECDKFCIPPRFPNNLFPNVIYDL